MLDGFSLRSAVVPPFLALPQMVVVTVSVKPSEVLDLPYTPALLLEVRCPMVVVADEEFSLACRVGFDDYFEGMMHGTQREEMQFEDHFYTWQEVDGMVRELFSTRFDGLSWHVGCCLGWLSALALTNRSLAERGLELLCSLANAAYRSAC